MYRVDIVSSKDYIFKVKSKDYEFLVDTKGAGITPPDTLLASLGTCIGVYIRKYAEGLKLSLGQFSIHVEAEFVKEPPISFRQINVHIDLGDTKLDGQIKTRLLEFIKNCPVHNTLKIEPNISVEIL